MEVHPNLIKAVWQWEADWKETLRLINNLNTKSLFQSPENGGWSIHQVIQHLILSETQSLQYVSKKLFYPELLKPPDIQSFFRQKLLILALSSPIRFKAPDWVSTPKLPLGESWEETLESMEKTHKKLLELAFSTHAELSQKLVFRHPVAGRMPMIGMYLFFSWHNRHHQKQIKRLLRKLA